MEEKLICPICGEATRVYMGNARRDKLCGKHADLLKKGEIVLQDNGLFLDAKTKKVLNMDYQESKEVKKETKTEILTKKEYKACILCGSNSFGKPLCKDCYYECQDLEDEVDRNKKPFELKDYYFNLKSANFRVVSKDNLLRNIKMMYALANVTMDSYDDSSLISRVNDDAVEAIKNADKKKEIKENSFTEQSDSQKSSIMRTLDGHIVKSQGEVIVDNILYNNQICHCYEKDVVEISSANRTIKSDWFVPISGNKGIYIEYWGMTTTVYLKNKDEKKKMYKDNEIPLIEIEKDDVKDVSGLDARIMREIKKLKEDIKKKI